jgi:integrase
MPRKRKRTRQYGFGRVFQRGKRWSVRFHGREYATGSTDEQDAIKLLLELRQKEAAGELPDSRNIGSVPQLIAAFLKRKKLAPGTRTTYEGQARLHLNPFFSDVPLSRITTDLLSDYREHREKQEVQWGHNAAEKQHHHKVGQTSINRELALLRAAMRDLSKRRPKALAGVPYFPMESEKGNVRKGFLRDEEFEEKLLPELPRHLKALSACAFFGGARRGEWLSVQVTGVDMEALIVYVPDTKTGVPRDVPIFDGPMRDLLEAELIYHNLMCPDEPYLFTYDGKRMKGVGKAWRKACVRAGFPELHFHDLRRSAARGLRDAGVPQTVRMRVLGHKTDSMDRRYGISDRADMDVAREKRGMGRAGKTQLRRVK